MRILIFHGYLLGGTGSNVYNARLAEALVRLGHEVHLLCQERHPERLDFLDAAGDWDSGRLTVAPLGDVTADGPRCTMYRPDIGGLLPLYVQDRYEGTRAKTFAQCTDSEIATYVQANVDAVREVAGQVRPDVALANHLVMGPVVLARALVGKTPYAVKVHGSALEYTVKPEPARFLSFAREGLAGAQTVLVGSRHTGESLWEALGDVDGPQIRRRTRLGPPGVDVERFTPRSPQAAEAAMRALLERLRAGVAVAAGEQASAFARDDRLAADALQKILDDGGALVAYVGKLIVSKGVDLLIAAWPLVLREVPDARLVIVGFGAYEEGLRELIDHLATGDLEGARQIARRGRAREAQDGASGSSQGGHRAPEEPPLRHLLAFLDSLVDARTETPAARPIGAGHDTISGTRPEEVGGDVDAYCAAARVLAERVVFTGRLDHEELADILPACEALVVPSTFPEAFGMVAAEAAACGVLPVSAAHSGLAEVSEALAQDVPVEARGLLSFPIDDRAVRAISQRLVVWLRADRALRAETRAALVSVAHERWSWAGVARCVIAAARGEPVARPFG